MGIIGIILNLSGVRMLDGMVNDAVEARSLSLNPRFPSMKCSAVVKQNGFVNRKGSSYKLFPHQPHRHLLCFLGTWGRWQDSGRTRTTRQESVHQRGECSSWQGRWFINLFLVDFKKFQLGWKTIWLLELAWFQLGCSWRSEIGGVSE